jgi:hypothetical protein
LASLKQIFLNSFGHRKLLEFQYVVILLIQSCIVSSHRARKGDFECIKEGKMFLIETLALAVILYCLYHLFFGK